MSFPSYPRYKDSGVKWLGEVPEHWGVGQSRRLFAQRNERGREGDLQLTASQEHGVIYQEDFIRLEGRRVVEVIKGADILKHVEPNDFVISMRSFQGGIEWCNLRGCISSAYVMLIPCERIHGPFFAYALKSRSYIQALQTTSNLVRDGQALRYENFTKVDLPLVPMDEQTAIAEFLDRETAKIDGLVAEQQRLMELLKEKRQAIISQAVTQGLNPKARMKPSGIEWLGDVPAHWEIRKLSQLFRAGKGKNGQLLTKEFCAENEGDYPVYSGQTENEGVMGTWNQFEFDFGENGVLFSTTVGAKAMHLRQLFGKFSLSQNCMIIWATSDRCLTRFFYYHFQPLFQYQRAMIPEHMQPSFRMEDLYGYFIALPPSEEQAAIVSHLDAEIVKFDALTAEAQRAIDLLLERRTALISAAVTGQIDVRPLLKEEAA